MTIQPEMEALSPPRGLNGTTTEPATLVSEVAVPDVAAPRPSRVSSRSITPDYRLRGLDLETAVLIEPPAPPRRRQHPALRRKRRRLLLQWLIVLVVVAVVGVLLRVAVARPYAVNTTAMVPTLQPDSSVLVVTSTLLTGAVQRG
ncbi:MAG: hypothetical protein QOJ19_1412, partial [Acidimicrobiia bacterium]|nr:hypothetical protein [Acidimicrobiia bacterium]